MLYLYLLLISLSFFLFLLKSNYKIFDFIIGISMILLASSMYNGYDTENYIKSFELLRKGSVDYSSLSIVDFSIIYYSLVSFFQNIGFQSFFAFKFVILSLFSIPAYKWLSKFSQNNGLFFFLYLISVFFDDSMQLRNTISLALLVYSFYFLYSDSKYSSLKFILIILLASLNHASFILYASFILIKLNCKKIINILFFASIILYIYSFITHDLSFINLFSNTMDSSKILLYIQAGATNYGSIYVLIFWLGEFSLVRYCNLRIQELDFEGNSSFDIKKTSMIIYNMFIIMSIVLPICVLSLSAIRLLRNITPFFIVEIVLFISFPSFNKSLKSIIFFFSVLIMLYFMYLSNFIMGPPEDIIYSVFNGNLNWIKNIFI